MISIFFLTDFDELKKKASFYAWMFFLVGVGALLSVALQQLCLGYAGTKLATRIRILLLGTLLRQEVSRPGRAATRQVHSLAQTSPAAAQAGKCARAPVAPACACRLPSLTRTSTAPGASPRPWPPTAPTSAVPWATPWAWRCR